MLPMSCLVSVVCVASITGCAGSRAENYKPAAGYVPDANTAIRIAQAVWEPIYGEREIQSERPFHAEQQGNAWYVYGTVPQPKRPGWVRPGGSAVAVIDRRTGSFLRINHEE